MPLRCVPRRPEYVPAVPEPLAPGEMLTVEQLALHDRIEALGVLLESPGVLPETLGASHVLFEASRTAPVAIVDPPFAPGWDNPPLPTSRARLARIGRRYATQDELDEEDAAQLGAQVLVSEACTWCTYVARTPAPPEAGDVAALLDGVALRVSGGEETLRENLAALLLVLRAVERHNALVRVAQIVREYDARRPPGSGQFSRYMSSRREIGHAAEIVIDALLNDVDAKILPWGTEVGPPTIDDDVNGKVDHWYRARGDDRGLPLAALDTKTGATGRASVPATSWTEVYPGEESRTYGRAVLRMDSAITERYVATWILHVVRGVPMSPAACYAASYAALATQGYEGEHFLPPDAFRDRMRREVGRAVRREIANLLGVGPLEGVDTLGVRPLCDPPPPAQYPAPALPLTA